MGSIISILNYRIKDRCQGYWRPSTVRRGICLAALRRQQIISGHPPHGPGGHPISMSWTSRNVGSTIRKNTTNKNEKNGNSKPWIWTTMKIVKTKVDTSE